MLRHFLAAFVLAAKSPAHWSRLLTHAHRHRSPVDADSVERIASITDNIGVVYAGMGPDFRLLVRKGQKKAQAYRLTYGVRARARAPPPRRAAPRRRAPAHRAASLARALRRSRSRCWS